MIDGMQLRQAGYQFVERLALILHTCVAELSRIHEQRWARCNVRLVLQEHVVTWALNRSHRQRQVPVRRGNPLNRSRVIREA